MLEFALANHFCTTVEEKLIFLYLMKTYGVYSPIDTIAHTIGMPSVTVTSVLKNMVRDGYVERKQLNDHTAEGPLYGYGCKL